MNDKHTVRISRHLALHLRHAPEKIGIRLEDGGWIDVELLLKGMAANGFAVTRSELEHVVSTSDKQRFALNENGTKIRANQGHSVAVELDLPRAEPPSVLYHGTVAKFFAAIQREGLRPMNRHDVHLSSTMDVAITVGARRGQPLVLEVDAAAMHNDGLEFRLGANGVWLTNTVAPRYLRRIR